MASKRLTQDEIDFIKQLYLDGNSISKIKEITGRSFSTIQSKLKDLGIFKKHLPVWTDEQINFLKNNYSDSDWDYILSNIKDHNKENIIHMASKLGLRREIYFWNKDDLNILKKSYENNLSIKEIYDKLNGKFSESSILTKASTIGLKKREMWSDEENSLLIQNYRLLEMDDICKLFPNRSKCSIIAHAINLGLNYKTIWSDEEVEYLRKHYTNMSDEEIGIQLGRSKDSVRGKRFLENLQKPVHKGIYNYISEYIRKRNKEWKRLSMKKCNYKCVVTGKPFNEIHHLYGMNKILQETLNDLGYEENVLIENLNDSDLEKILNHFFIVQNKYPLGICLSKEIHKMFHDEYGYGDNTPEQFNDFLNKHNYKIA